ncbi:MAG: site-specific integrase [Pseudolabrys sp.]
MSRHRGTIKSRSSGSYRIRYSLGRDPVSGKRRFATATVRGTRKEAERELVRLLRTVDTGEHVDPSRMTVGDWLELWTQTTKAEVSPKSHERYAEIVRCYLKPALGTIGLQRLTPSDIQKAYNNFNRTLDRNPSPRTRRHVHRILKSALARAVEQQALPRNPADALKRLPKVEVEPITVLTVEQSKHLLKTISHSTTYWPTLIALTTGMRRGEVLALRWKNVDLEQGTVRVVESLEETKAGIRFKSTKTDKGRAVLLPKFALEELRGWKREQAEKLLQLGVRQTGESLVCGREDGKPKIPNSLTHKFMYFAAKAGLPKVRFHDLRHSHATQLLASGVHPKIVQERLGHSTITVTMDLYSHVSETIQSDATTRLDQAYGKW